MSKNIDLIRTMQSDHRPAPNPPLAHSHAHAHAQSHTHTHTHEHEHVHTHSHVHVPSQAIGAQDLKSPVLMGIGQRLIWVLSIVVVLSLMVFWALGSNG